MASKTLIHAVFDFYHQQVFPQVKDYFAFHNFDQLARDRFNAALLRKIERSSARKIESALVINKNVPTLLAESQLLAWALEIVPLKETQQRSNQLEQQHRESPYFYALLDYELNCSFLKLDNYLAAHYRNPKTAPERRWIEKRIQAAIKEKSCTEEMVIHLFAGTLSEISDLSLTKDNIKMILDHKIKAVSLKDFMKQKDQVLRFYGLREVTGNPKPEND